MKNGMSGAMQKRIKADQGLTKATATKAATAKKTAAKGDASAE